MARGVLSSIQMIASRFPGPQGTPGLLLALGALFFPVQSRAAEPSGSVRSPIQSMTLPEALAYARVHQPAVAAALARIKASEADARATRAQWVPYLGATAQLIGGTANNTTASYFSSTGVDLPRIGGTPVAATGGLEPFPSSLVAIGVRQELFDFGRIAAQAAVDDAFVDFQKLGAEAAEQMVALGVEESYFAVQASHSVLRASEEAYQRAVVHRDQARAGVRAGLRAPIELTRSEADVARFDVGRVRAEGGLVAAQAAFAAAVGIPQDRLDAGGEVAPPTALPSLQLAIDQAAQRDPVLRAAAAQLRIQEAVTDSIAARLRPDLVLSGSFSGREGGAPPALPVQAASHGGWLPDIPNWDVAIVLRVPIFDWVTWKRVDASRQREEIRKAELELVRQGQTAAVQRAWVAVDAAQKALAALNREVEAALANSAQADARFKSGLATVVELADAEALRTTAEIQLALGKFEQARQRAILGRLIVEGP